MQLGFVTQSAIHAILKKFKLGVFYLPEPFKEGFVEFSELSLGLLVVHHAFLVESLNFIVPFDEEIDTQDLLIYELFQESRGVLGHFLVVLFDKVEDHGLHEMLDSDFTLFFDQSNKQRLVFGPVFEDATFDRWWENTTEGDEK